MDSSVFFFLQVFLLFSAALVRSHASLPAQVYWQTKLPNTPMPSAIRDLLRPDVVGEEKSGTSVEVGKGGVHVDAGKGKGGETTVGVGKGGVTVGAGKGKPGNTDVNVGPGGVHVNAPGKGTTVDVGHKGGVNVNAGHGNTHVGVGKGGVNVNAGHGKTHVGVGKGGVNVNAGHGKTHVGVGKGGVGVVTGPHKGGHPVIVHVAPGKNPFAYNYAAAADQLDDDPKAAYFFLEKDLRPGHQMSQDLRFSTSDSVLSSPFLPRTVAESIPFSSTKLPEILNRFSIKPDSAEAETMKNTLESCEEAPAKGESKRCATSLESMVDFATSKLGKDARPLTTTTGKFETEGRGGYNRAGTPQVYTMASGIEAVGSSKSSVTCHSEAYAYAVYNCHETRETKAYKVPMVGKDGRKVEAVAVCHRDTSGWNPKHLAFQVLKVKPGSVPICHFLPLDHILWIHPAHAH